MPLYMLINGTSTSFNLDCEDSTSDSTSISFRKDRDEVLIAIATINSLCQSDQFPPCFDRYQNQYMIERGTFAEVFMVKNLVTKTFCAIKRSKSLFRGRKEQERLLSEAVVMQNLCSKCPNIIEFYSAWQENCQVHILMELAEKGSIKGLLDDSLHSNQTIPTSTIWHIAHDVANGLAFIHANGYVHLDIKPANLLVDINASVKISDFGLSNQCGRQDGLEGDSRYMAKELLNDSERRFSADIFSFGITLLEIAGVMNPRSPNIDKIFSSSFTKERSMDYSLPLEGAQWQNLRAGLIPSIPDRPLTLNLLIAAMMNPIQSQRPTASDILTLPDIVQSIGVPDNVLLSIPNMTKLYDKLSSSISYAQLDQLSSSLSSPS